MEIYILFSVVTKAAKKAGTTCSLTVPIESVLQNREHVNGGQKEPWLWSLKIFSSVDFSCYILWSKYTLLGRIYWLACSFSHIKKKLLFAEFLSVCLILPHKVSDEIYYFPTERPLSALSEGQDPFFMVTRVHIFITASAWLHILEGISEQKFQNSVNYL